MNAKSSIIPKLQVLDKVLCVKTPGGYLTFNCMGVCAQRNIFSLGCRSDWKVQKLRRAFSSRDENDADSILISIEKAHMSILLLHTIQANMQLC